MEMQQIRYFLAVTDTLNFTRAAEQCNVSQPALTRAIKALEEELGAPLINREHRNTHLTELGRLMEPYFRTIFEQSVSAKSAADAFAALGKASLKIGAMCTIGPSIISDFVARFARDFGEIDIEVRPLDLPALRESLTKGDLEIAFAAFPGTIDDNFHTLPLFTERFTAATSPDHPFAAKDALPCRDLDGEPYINRTNCEYFDVVSAAFEAQGIRMRQIFSSECNEWVLGMIKSGLGVGFFPEFAVNDPGVPLTPLVEPCFTRTVRLATVRGRRHSPAVGAFVRLARAHRWPAHTAAPAGGSGLGRRGLEHKGEKYGAQQRHANGGDGRRPAGRLKNPSDRRRARKPAQIIRSEV
jgi:DNA-binding transcriptional LysR family regulator